VWHQELQLPPGYQAGARDVGAVILTGLPDIDECELRIAF
jgi:hypothetical protein